VARRASFALPLDARPIGIPPGGSPDLSRSGFLRLFCHVFETPLRYRVRIPILTSSLGALLGRNTGRNPEPKPGFGSSERCSGGWPLTGSSRGLVGGPTRSRLAPVLRACRKRPVFSPDVGGCPQRLLGPAGPPCRAPTERGQTATQPLLAAVEEVLGDVIGSRQAGQCPTSVALRRRGACQRSWRPPSGTLRDCKPHFANRRATCAWENSPHSSARNR